MRLLGRGHLERRNAERRKRDRLAISGLARPEVWRRGCRVWPALLIVLGVALACRQPGVIGSGYGASPLASATPLPTLPPTPTQWPTPVNQPWRTVALGVERRDLAIHGPHFRFPATVHLVRLNPSYVKIHTHYSPEVPITIAEWQRETGALVVVNGGFFDAAKRTEGLMVSFGQTYGRSYSQGGMFVMQNGQASIRDLTEQPYREEERFDVAMQAYPMLVGKGGVAVYPNEDGRYNRRTAVGVDRLGRVVLVVIDEPVVSLYELSRWLAASDLNLEAALNLDGGSSTGLAVVAGDEETIIDSHGPLPIVIAVYP